MARSLNFLGLAVAAATLGVVATVEPASAQAPVPVDLGTLGGGYSAAYGINGGGTIVGESSIGGDAATHAFVWTQAEGMFDLGTLGGTSSNAYGINDSGIIVGASSISGDVATHAFMWTQTGGMVNLGTLGGTYSTAVAINESGTIVGYSSIAGDAATHAFAWTQAWGMVDLGTLGGTSSFAYAVNDNGTIVGEGVMSGDTTYHAFMWTQADGMVDLGTLGGSNSNANGITNSGTIVGDSSIALYAGQHAFMWTQADGMLDLGTLGGSYSNAGGINGTGTIVGGGPIGGDAATHALAWTHAGGIVDLGTLGGADSTAYGINDSGTIVGWSSIAGSVFRHATLWRTAPPPNTPSGENIVATSLATLPNGATTTVSLIFDSVQSDGTTSATTSTTGQPPPAGFKLTNPPVYYEITTTAQFTGSVRVCLRWIQEQIANENNVNLFHHEGGNWVNITEDASRDTVNNLVCGTASSLSPFTLFEVKYLFTGFFQPVDNPPVTNSVKAGAAIPVKFSLGGDHGLIIFATDYPRVQAVQCQTGAVIDSIEETVTAGGSSLTYQAATGQYSYIWKTDKAWAGSCRELQVKFSDGEVYTARFTLAK